MPVASGTLGLMVGLRAVLDSLEGDARQVLMPSFTFAATINAVLWCGLRPVFVDVETQSWHLDPDCLEDALAARCGRVAAVLACSTFGIPPLRAHQTAWERAARAAGVPLLVDSAAGFGAAAEDGQMLGRQGDAEVFSFHATKPFAIGEGGLITTTDPETAQRATRLTNFGFVDGIVESDVGLNAKLPEWAAATGLAVLDGFGDVMERRRTRAARILRAIEPYGYRPQAGADNAVWQFVPVLAPSPVARAAALELAAENDVELRSATRCRCTACPRSGRRRSRESCAPRSGLPSGLCRSRWPTTSPTPRSR